MPLNLPTSAMGPMIPALKYDARSGRWFDAIRVQDAAGQWIAQNIDLMESGLPVQFLADLANAETGWVKFTPGAPPDFALVHYEDAQPARPSADHQFCVRVMVYAPKLFGPQTPAREIMATSRAAQTGINEVLATAEGAEEWGRDLLPLIRFVKAKPVKTGQATNYQPVLSLESWHSRPADFAFVPRAGAPSAAPSAAPRAAAPMPTGMPQRAAPSGRDLDDSIPF